MQRFLLSLALTSTFISSISSFVVNTPFTPSRIHQSSFQKEFEIKRCVATNSKLSAVSKTQIGDKFRRQKILNPPNKSRDGHYFKMDRFRGDISFGYTADLITKLPVPPSKVQSDIISKWLSNAERVAFAIWDEDLISELGPQFYRLQLIAIKFVTIGLKPTVDVLMWTENESDANGNGNVVFFLENKDFNPNVQLLPGVNFSAESLGIQIDVAGELRVSSDKQGLTGSIGFITSGKLPPPLRLLPETALKGAASLINKQIADFAVKSFEKGALKEFSKYVKEEGGK